MSGSKLGTLISVNGKIVSHTHSFNKLIFIEHLMSSDLHGPDSGK